MRFSSRFDPSRTVQKLEARARGFSASLPDQLGRAGRLIAVSLATSAVPYGIDVNARTAGEIATKRDIRRVYATPGDVFEAFPNQHWAALFWSDIKHGRFASAQRVMQNECPNFRGKEIRPFDGGVAHKNARNNRGRVPKSQKPVFVVQTTRDLNKYIKDEMKLVGFGKDGWGSCAKILGGTRGLPQWVTRHKAPATVIEDHNAENPTITMVNEVNYAQDILDPSEKREAVEIGLDRLQQALFNEERRVGRANPLS